MHASIYDEGVIDAGSRVCRSVNNLVASIIYLFLIAPTLVVIPMSFGNKSELIFPPKEYSWDLYILYLSDASWMAATRQSMLVGIAVVGIALVIGVPAAFALERSHARIVAALRLFIIMPIFIPSIVLALGLYMYLSQLHLIGSTLAIILSHSIIAIPFVVLAVSAGLKNVEANLELVARILGGSVFLVFRRVTLPLLVPTLITAGLFAFLISLDEVVITSFVSEAKTSTLPVRMFSAIQWEVSPIIAVISVLLTTISVIFCLIGAYMQRRGAASSVEGVG